MQIGDAYDLVQVPKRSTPLHVAAAVPGPGGLQCALVLLQHYVSEVREDDGSRLARSSASATY